MKMERSCGGVVFTRRDDDILYVIIRHRGGHCGFPKGHMEPGETQRQTALREIREEVGLTVSFVSDFRAEEQYVLPGRSGITKRVVYFLAEFAGQTPTPQPEEIARVYLLPYEEAMKTLTFPEARRILTQADQFLRR